MRQLQWMTVQITRWAVDLRLHLCSWFLVPVKSIIKSSRGCRMKLSTLSEFQSAILAEVPNRNSSTILEMLEAKREQRQTVEM